MTKNQNYINTLMDLYKDMSVKNRIHNEEQTVIKAQRKKENSYFYSSVQPFSDTMLHSIIVILQKLNNKEI